MFGLVKKQELEAEVKKNSAIMTVVMGVSGGIKDYFALIKDGDEITKELLELDTWQLKNNDIDAHPSIEVSALITQVAELVLQNEKKGLIIITTE